MKVNRQKKNAVFWTTFFLIDPWGGSSAVEAVEPGQSERNVFVLKNVLVYN